MEEKNNNIINNMPSQKSIFEQDIEMKQNLIKAAIIDKNYDKNAFFNFCMNKKKEGGNAFSEPIMRQAHNLGDVTQAKTNQVDMKPALDRTPGFSMGSRKK